MNGFHLFFDANNKAIVIDDHPDALDKAPYDKITRRFSNRKVDAGHAELALRMHGGIAIYADKTVTVQADYS